MTTQMGTTSPSRCSASHHALRPFSLVNSAVHNTIQILTLFAMSYYINIVLYIIMRITADGSTEGTDQKIAVWAFSDPCDQFTHILMSSVRIEIRYS
jgi:hypothetical protein